MGEHIHIAIVSDERVVEKELLTFLTQIFNKSNQDVKFIEANGILEAIKLVEQYRFHAMFLDINLGNKDGMLLMSTIKTKQPDSGIVFVTAYREHAAKAFDMDVVDYIIKPFDLERIRQAIEKLEKRGYLKQKEEVLSERSFHQEKQRLAVNEGGNMVLIDAKDIIYVEANNRTCLLHMENQVYEESVTLNHLEKILDSQIFYRIHKSYIANLDQVAELQPSYNNGYAMRMRDKENSVIPISRNKTKEVKQLFML